MQSQSQDHPVGAPTQGRFRQPLSRTPSTEPPARGHHPCSPIQCPTPPLPPASSGPDTLARSRCAHCRMGPHGDIHTTWRASAAALPSLAGNAAQPPPILQLHWQSRGTRGYRGRTGGPWIQPPPAAAKHAPHPVLPRPPPGPLGADETPSD